VLIVETHAEHCVGKQLDNDSLKFKKFFFSHSDPSNLSYGSTVFSLDAPAIAYRRSGQSIQKHMPNTKG
jgi:hypothetical protein